MPNWPIAPDAAGVVSYINYSIFFNDIDEYEGAVETFGGNQVLRSPAYMRDSLEVPMEAVWGDEKWFYFYAPPDVMAFNLDGSWGTPRPIRECKAYIYPHDPDESPYWWPPLVFTFDWAQDWNGAPAYPTDKGWGRGVAVSWIWACTLTMSGGVEQPDPPGGFAPMMNRRFFTGFETTNGGQTQPSDSPELDSGTIWSECYSRCASRTPDGIGFACRGNQSTLHFTNEQGLVVNGENSWERFYMRIVKLPTTATNLWTAGTESTESITITIDETGSLNAFTIDNFAQNSGPLVPGGSSPLLPGIWYKVDLYILFKIMIDPPDPDDGCSVRMSVTCKNSIYSVSMDVPTSQINLGFGPVQRSHSTSRLGPSVTNNGMEIDFDDWSNMDPGDPFADPPPDISGTLDEQTGHHVQLIRNIGVDSQGAFDGDYRATEQSPTANPIATLTSIVSGDSLSIISEMNNDPMGPIAAVRQMGALAINGMTVVSKDIGSTDDQVGMLIQGTDPQIGARTMATTLQGYAHVYNIPSDDNGLRPPPEDYEPVYPYFVKSTDTNETNVSFLMIEAQFCGAFGIEDYEAEDTIGGFEVVSYHNAPYYTSILSRATLPTFNSVAAASGTYVGNGTGQDIEIELPGIHWLYIRNTTTSVKTWWWSTMLGPHAGTIADDILPGLLTRVTWAENGNTVISVVGNDAHSNQNGITYQYFAFSDVASRVLLNTTWRHSNDDMNNALFDSSFLPEFVMVQQETVKNNIPDDRLWIKGPGFTDDTGKIVDGSFVEPNVMTFETGNIISRSELTSSVLNNAVACFKAWDGWDVIPNILYIGEYTGDGTGNRDISTPLNDRRPIFAIICPVTNAPAWARDASHSGNNSSRVYDGFTFTTAIRGGDINIVKVGSVLNANGVAYSMLVFPSCSTDEGNDGWGVDDVCGIAEPGWGPPFPPWTLPIPAIPADIAITGSGGIVLSGETAKLIILDLSGIYTIVPGKTNDTLLDRQVSQTELVVKIPDPSAKTGYIGG